MKKKDKKNIEEKNVNKNVSIDDLITPGNIEEGDAKAYEEKIADIISDEEEPITPTKKKKSINSLLKNLSPRQISNEINGLGYKFALKNLIFYSIAFSLVIVLFCLIMKLPIILTVIATCSCYTFLPIIIKNGYKRKIEAIKFADISQYIEQMLYAFKNSRKIYKSIEDILPLFKTSPLYNDLMNMHDNILTLGNQKALSIFESKYDCEKVSQLHKFLIESETIGGEIEDTIELLLEDNTSWKERTEMFQKDRKKWRVSTVFAIVISFSLCIMMEKMLPEQVNISNNVLVQISTVVTLFLEFVLFTKLDCKLSKSYLNNLSTYPEETIKRYYEEMINYSTSTSIKKGIKTAIVFLILTAGLYIVFEHVAAIVIGLMITAFAFAMPFLKHKSHNKIIKEEITTQFPKWLMSMAMLAQSNSIQVALFKSIYTAPTVLKPELIRLNNALTEDPTSVEPYFEFMKEFEMPEITASIKMFYAISSGAGSDTQKQIKDIIKRNNRMVDKSEKQANDNFVAGLYALFLAPQMVGAMKLMIDMVVFFLNFTNMNV